MAPATIQNHNYFVMLLMYLVGGSSASMQSSAQVQGSAHAVISVKNCAISLLTPVAVCIPQPTVLCNICVIFDGTGD